MKEQPQQPRRIKVKGVLVILAAMAMATSAIIRVRGKNVLTANRTISPEGTIDRARPNIVRQQLMTILLIDVHVVGTDSVLDRITSIVEALVPHLSRRRRRPIQVRRRGNSL